MSDWQDRDIEQKVIEILQYVQIDDPSPNLGSPFLTAYQLAIEIVRRYGKDALPGNIIGGEGAGVHFSQTSYLASELSHGIKAARDADRDYRIEGAFLSDLHITNLTFDDNGRQVHSSVRNISMFRIRSVD